MLLSGKRVLQQNRRERQQALPNFGRNSGGEQVCKPLTLIAKIELN